MPDAIFLSECNTVHEYKSKLNALGSAARHKSRNYEIAECYVMKYDKYIWRCNHIDEWFSSHKKLRNTDKHKVALFYSLRADKVLLLSLVDHKVAVLYNAGQKVEIRPNTHRARTLRNAEKRRLRLLQKNIDMVKSSVAENALELLNNLDKVHTTEMGAERIKRNLELDCDVVDWCKEQISKSSNIIRRGKNWYIHIDDVVITVNAYSYTIITAHRSKR